MQTGSTSTITLSGTTGTGDGASGGEVGVSSSCMRRPSPATGSPFPFGRYL